MDIINIRKEMTILKERIKKIRKELDLTQQKFADRLGVKRNTIAMYEMGKTFPSEQTTKSICREFNINEEWLRTGNGEMFIASPSAALDMLSAEYGLSDGDYVLIEKFVNLKAEKRAAALDFILQVAEAIHSSGIDTSLTNQKPKEMSIDEKVEQYRQSLILDAMHEENRIASAEAAYEKSLGIVPKKESTASNTIGGTDRKSKVV